VSGLDAKDFEGCTGDCGLGSNLVLRADAMERFRVLHLHGTTNIRVNELVKVMIARDSTMEGKVASASKVENIERLMDKGREWKDIGVRANGKVLAERAKEAKILFTSKVIWFDSHSNETAHLVTLLCKFFTMT
jgi:predicted TIM-barrel enzyme